MSFYLPSIIAVFVVWQLGFLYAFKKLRNDIADVLWGLTFVIASLVAVYTRSRQGDYTGLGVADWLALASVTFWGLRLAYHIGTRFASHDDEDRRYNNWRKEWGANWKWRTYLQVFTLQPILALLIVWPVLRAVKYSPRDLSAWVVAGVVIWLTGFFFESVSDAQLKAFKANSANKGKIMDRGLWSWSRHPNYFGEVVQWWGIFFICVQPNGWWLALSPIVITFFILKVSGVTMLEELMKGRPGFKEYVARTSQFIPLPPKRGVSAMPKGKTS